MRNFSLTNLISSKKECEKSNYDLFLAELKIFLQAQLEIRMYVEDSPGLGHQSSTVHLMKRLIELGFGSVGNRQITIVCHSSEGVLSLSQLIPGIDKDEEDQVTSFKTIKLRVITLEKFEINDPHEIPLGITGGFDNVGGPGEVLMLPPLSLMVKHFVALQPYRWDRLKNMAHSQIQSLKPSGGMIPSLISIDLTHQEVLGEDTFIQRAYYVETPIILSKTDRDYLWKYHTDQLYCINEVFRDVDSQKVELCVAYGIGAKNAVNARSSTLLINLCAGIIEAQRKKPSKSVIISFSTIASSEFTAISAIFDHANTVAKKNAFQSYSSATRLHECIIFHLDLTKPADIRQKLNNLQPGQVLILQVGTVPKILFDFVFSRSTLPTVFEGQGTANIALNIGRPFLQMASKDVGTIYPTTILTRSNYNPIAIVIQTAANSLYTSLDSWSDDFKSTPAGLISNFISVAYLSTTPLADYFKTIHEFYHNESNDKFLMALMFYYDIKDVAEDHGVIMAKSSTDIIAKSDKPAINATLLDDLYSKIKDHINEKSVTLVPDVLSSDGIYDFYTSLVTRFCIADANVIMSADKKKVTLTGISNFLDIQKLKIVMVFTISNNKLQSRLTCSLPEGDCWQLDNIDWFSISKPEISILVGNDMMNIVGTIAGTVHIGIDIKLSMQLPSCDNKWSLQASFPTEKPSIAYFTQLIGGVNLVSALPPPFSTFADLSVQSIDTVYDVAASRMDYIALKIGTSPQNSWKILPKLEILGLDFACTVANPGSSSDRVITYVISGGFTIGKKDANQILVVANVPNFRVNATLVKGAIQLGDLLTMFWDGVSMDLKSEISLFNLDIDPTGKKYSLNCSVKSDWKFLSIPLKQPLDFTMTGMSLQVVSQQGITSGEFVGLFNIGADKSPGGSKGVDIRLSAGYADKTWTLSGSTGKDQTISLIDIAYTLLKPFGVGDMPNWVTNGGLILNISNIHFKAVIPDESTKKTNSYNIGGTVDWQLKIASFDIKINAVVDITFKGKAKGEDESKPTGKITGKTKLLGLTFEIGYEFGDKKNIYLQWEGIKAVCDIREKETVFTLKFTKISLGEIITKFMNALIPGFKLPAPWNLLDSIKLDGVEFTYTRNLEDKTKSEIKISYPIGVDLGFLKISNIKLTKDESGVHLGFKGTFLGMTIDAGNEATKALAGKGSNVEELPTVPGAGSQVFELKFLGMGQHIELANSSSFTSVNAAITDMKKAFTDTNNKPNTIPVKAGSGQVLRFNQNSNWLIGADFTVAQFYNMAIVFNDPNLYGLRIGVAEKAEFLKNLQFEILYKKVNDVIGVYQVELQLPDCFRQLEFGAVSVTLPNIGIRIYTNGNFHLDVGWPVSITDFSRSFTIQVFPFIGAGGFYFSSLTGATATGLPVVINGQFNTVIEAGLALSIGIGKTIDKGILKAGLSLTVVGMFQGTYAIFVPNPNIKEYSGETDVYYKFSGTIAIVGRVYGEVNFAIISASVEIMAYIMANIVVEAYKVIPIYFEAGVRVSLILKINLGLFKISIHCSFNMTISESFEIGSDKTSESLWYKVDHLNNELYAKNLGVSRETINYRWQPIIVDKTKETFGIDIYFMPHLTVSGETTEQCQSPQYIGMLYLDTGTNVSKNHTHSGMNALAMGCLYWATGAIIGSQEDSVSLDWLKNQHVSYDQLNTMLAYMKNRPDNMAPFNYKNESGSDIFHFLEKFFTINISAVDATEKTELTASVFPMLPDLQMETILNSKSQRKVDFARQTMTGTNGYIHDVSQLLRSLQVSAENAITAEHYDLDESNRVSNFGFEEQTNLSMATFIFTDFVSLIVKQLLQNALDYLYADKQVSIKVSELVDKTVTPDKVLQLGGMASRFMMHGLRLPEPPSVDLGKIEPLYVLTGQQWSIPQMKETDVYEICLMTNANWIKFKNPMDNKLKLTLDRDSKLRNEKIKNNILNPSIIEQYPKAITNINVVPQNFSLGGNTTWDYPGDIFKIDQQMPTLWKTPSNFEMVLRTNQNKSLDFTLQTITKSGQTMTKGDITNFKWATSLSINIEKATAQDILDTPLADNIYNLVGADDDSIRILEDMLIYMKEPSHGNKFIEQVQFLIKHDPISGKNGFTSIKNGAFDAAIVKANLSTETNPEAICKSVLNSLDGVEKCNTLNDANDFVTLLWECSIVRSGGFYFYYRTTADGKGMPDYLFTETGTASIQIIITYADFIAQPFVNTVITGDNLDFSKTTVYAQSPDITMSMPILMPGNVGYELHRNSPNEFNSNNNPPTPAEDQVYLQNQFNLVGVSLPSVKAYQNYMPAGATDPMSQDDIQNIKNGESCNSAASATWKYSSVIPYYKFVQSLGDDKHYLNPYAGIGTRVRMDLNWQDMFGNVLTKVIKTPSVSMDLLYTDPILSISQWPSASCFYIFEDRGRGVELFVNFYFDTSRYDDNMEGAKNNASIDLINYMTLFYQLHTRDILMKITSTIEGTKGVPDGFNKKIDITKLSDGFITPIIDYLKARIQGESGESQTIATYTISEAIDRAKIADYVDTIPLIVTIHMERIKNVDPNFTDVPGVMNTTTAIKPLFQSNPKEKEQLSIAYFATKFENAFKNQPRTGILIKIATSSDKKESSNVSDASSPIWMVRFDDTGRKGINYTYDNSKVYFFAPIPLATSLISLDAAIKCYETGISFKESKSVQKKFASVDLDDWGKRFLDAVDSFLSPGLAVPLFLLDNGRRLQEILDIKENIANAIEGTIDFIIDSEDKKLTGANVANAQQKWRQEILKELSATYKYSAVIQTPVNVNSSWQGSNTDPVDGISTTPKFYGKMTGEKFVSTNSDVIPSSEYNLSTSKLPLGNGGSWLTYLFECKETSEYRNFRFSNMLYKISHLEQQIKSMGIDQYAASTWLTFVIPLEDSFSQIGANVIPIPLRAYPALPSITDQKAEYLNDIKEVTLQTARLWDFVFTYKNAAAAQDTIEVEITLNIPEITPKGSFNAMAKRLTLDEALAQFIESYPQINADFTSYLSNLTPQDIVDNTPRCVNSRIVVDAFKTIINDVAEAWDNWNQVNRRRPTLYGNLSSKAMPLGQEPIVLDFTVIEIEDQTTQDLNVHIKADPTDKFIPKVNIHGYTAIEIGKNTYKYLNNETKIPLTYKERNINPSREVLLNDLDILNIQNAWGGVQIVRNQQLLQDTGADNWQKTNKRFLYKTPLVKFYTKLITSLRNDTVIDIASIKTTKYPNHDSLEESIKALFYALTEGVELVDTLNIKIAVDYLYFIPDTSFPVTVPVLLTLPLYLNTNDRGVSFADSFAGRLKAWLVDNNLPDGTFNFGMDVFSSLDSNTLVLQLLFSLKNVRK